MTASNSMGVKNEGWAPDIQGKFKVIYHSNSWSEIADGAFAPQGNPPAAQIAGGGYCNNYTIGFMASRSWAGYNDSVTTISAANLTMKWLIKYI